MEGVCSGGHAGGAGDVVVVVTVVIPSSSVGRGRLALGGLVVVARWGGMTIVLVIGPSPVKSMTGHMRAISPFASFFFVFVLENRLFGGMN